jgi:hypothetical protein
MKIEIQLSNGYGKALISMLTECIFLILDCLCGLVIRVPGYRMQIHCVSCKVGTEFIYVM